MFPSPRIVYNIVWYSQTFLVRELLQVIALAEINPNFKKRTRPDTDPLVDGVYKGAFFSYLPALYAVII
jgi:hypothetical protein